MRRSIAPNMGDATVSYPTKPPTLDADGRTCLIVDDSQVVRRVARRIVQALNFIVEEAVDGQLALDVCRRSMPTAILLDREMPVMNGMDFLRSLRGLPGGNAPVVIFCTSVNTIGHIKEALSAGANEYVIKPFDAEVLQEKFSTVGLL
jgi:two-component system chemotaxis response regulator CheY